MELDILSKENWTIVKIREPKIYLDVVEGFKEKLLGLIEKGDIHLILNFKNVKIINSSGLGVLFLTWYRIKDKGGTIRITNLNPTIKEIFERIRLNKVFKIYDNDDDALKENI